jgi:hypothetical protein
MFRALWGVLALVGSAVAAALAPPALADDGGSPMRFEWRRDGPACGAGCRVWISASGYITADTAREFEAFASNRHVRGAVLALDSEGGSVLGTLALGRAIRALEMITTIGRSTADQDDFQTTLSPDGRCESMCVFLLLAGTRRYVPPQAKVMVHQIWLGQKRKQALESSYSAEELNVVQRDIGRLARYTIEMGGAVDLLETALRIPPWEPSHRLSGEELRRMRLSTVEALFVGEATGTTDSPPSPATVGHQGAPRD